MRIWSPIPLLFCSAAAFAQSDDRDFLTAFLEDNLSSAGRQVVITGFAGALSSQATLDQMTIADDDGIWLTLNDVALDWSRSSLLRGELSVDALTAAEIIVARAPKRAEGTLPSPEASGFSLPELPVSINIAKIAVDRIFLDAPLFGMPVEGTAEASMVLADGEGQAAFALERTGSGPDGKLTLNLGYSNASRQLVLDLDAAEDPQGIAATLLGLPGQPSAELTVKGNGPIDAFAAAITLRTDDVDRLKGDVTVSGTPEGTTKFAADLAGDLAPLFLPDYAAFFGSDVALVAAGERRAAGQTVLSDLSLRTRALTATGNLSLAADGLPDAFALNLVLASPDGEPVLLPISGPQQTRIQAANLTIGFDAASNESWQLQGEVEGLDRPDIAIEKLSLSGSGEIGRTPDGKLFDFSLAYGALGLAPADPAVSQALGPQISGAASGNWQEGSGKLTLTEFDLTGPGLSLTATATIGDLASGFTVDGKADAGIADLSRLTGLSGRPLGGQANATVSGATSLLGGTFDLTGSLDGTDLVLDQPELDRLLTGSSRIDFSVARSETGTDLRALELSTTGLRATASGRIASTQSDLTADLAFSDLSAMGGQYGGALTAKARFSGTPQSGEIQLDGEGDGMRVGQPEADKLLRGKSTVSAVLMIKEGVVSLASGTLSNPQVTAKANSSGAGSPVEIDARLANLGLLLPEFPGAVSVSGTAVPVAQGHQVNLKVQGSGQIAATIAGALDQSGRADLAIKGTAQAALANAFIAPRAISGLLRFDLAMKGPARLSALSGRVSLSGGRISSPDLGFALQSTELTANLSGGRAAVSARSAASGGGTVTLDGSVGLDPPNTANLSVGLKGLVLRDPKLYQTKASGDLTVTGPLAGGAVIAGAIRLGETELQIPDGNLAGIEPIPDLRHLREPGSVRATRERAGLAGGAKANSAAGTGRPYGLDVSVSAPSKVFLRGRGLDAELGGTVRLRGTTTTIVPDGALKLIRGRLDILGKRLNLTQAEAVLEGDLVPFVRIAAATESDGITSSVVIEGRADDPVVSFTSSPPLPQEEVLARLLFGRGLETLSAFQAVQLASAVATLAGKGGEGIVSKLRKGFGLDDLDLRTGEDGNTSLRAGKYISRNTYTEIEVDQQGKSQIQLNLDVTDTVTVRGRLGSDGETGIGVFLENDY